MNTNCKAKICLLSLLFILNSFSQNTFAQPYRVKEAIPNQAKAFNYVYFENPAAVKLDDNNYIVISNINNKDGIYKFNINSEKVTLLKALTQTPGTAITSVTQFASGNNKALVSIEGKLYSTDGTPNGTKLLKDFKYYSCCGGSLSKEFSRIKDINFINNLFYITIFDNPFDYNFNDNKPRSSELWVSDGTKPGTKKISSGHSLISSVFSARVNNIDSIVFIDEKFSQNTNITTTFWQISNSSNQAERLGSFLNTGSFGKAVNTSGGTFICSAYRGSYGKVVSSKLWRISNDGSLKIIENNCHEHSLSKSLDQLYYLDDNGLNVSNGSTNNSTLLIPSQIKENHFSIGSCASQNKVFYGFNAGKIIEIESGQARIIQTPLSNRVILESCFDNGFIINSFENLYESTKSVEHIYNIENTKFSKIKNLKRKLAPYSLQNNTGSIYTFEEQPVNGKLIKIFDLKPLTGAYQLLLDES